MTVFELIKSEQFDEASMIKVLSAITLGAIKGVLSEILGKDSVDDIFGDAESDAESMGLNTAVKAFLNMDARAIMKRGHK